MWFVSKKKYNTLLKQKENYEKVATDAVTQNGRLLEQWDGTLKEMKSIQKLNYQLVERNDELLARIKELEAELQGTREDNQKWAEDFEELDNAYGQLENDYNKLYKKLKHYHY